MRRFGGVPYAVGEYPDMEERISEIFGEATLPELHRCEEKLAKWEDRLLRSRTSSVDFLCTSICPCRSGGTAFLLERLVHVL